MPKKIHAIVIKLEQLNWLSRGTVHDAVPTHWAKSISELASIGFGFQQAAKHELNNNEGRD